jgi:hypothetical protein
MDSDENAQPPSPDSRHDEALPEEKNSLPEEDAKRQAMRKRKPLGDIVKPLTKEQIEALLRDPEVKERENLLDALPKGWDNDYQDDF